jgi:hypothetical protein
MSQIFTLRTIANMKKVFLRASSQHSKTKKEAILKDSGLHDIEVSGLVFISNPTEIELLAALPMGFPVFRPIHGIFVRHPALRRPRKMGPSFVGSSIG